MQRYEIESVLYLYEQADGDYVLYADAKVEIDALKENIRKLEFMVENGLGWEDFRNDITYP